MSNADDTVVPVVAIALISISVFSGKANGTVYVLWWSPPGMSIISLVLKIKPLPASLVYNVAVAVSL